MKTKSIPNKKSSARTLVLFVPILFVSFEIIQCNFIGYHDFKGSISEKTESLDASGNTITGQKYRGQPVGPYVHRSKDQKLIKVSLYENGDLNGLETMWHPNGQVSQQIMFQWGIRHGITKEWSDTGLLLKDSEYEKGIEVSQRAWRESGELYSNYKLRNGRYFGLKGGRLCQMAPTIKFEQE